MPRRLIAAAAFGAGACVLGAIFDPRTMAVSYRVAVVTVVSVPVGGLGVLMIGYLVRGRWTADLHDPLRSAVATLPAAGLLFVPIRFALRLIYPWAESAGDLKGFQADYYTSWFFTQRTVAYFVCASYIARWAVRSYGNEDRMTR